MKKNQWQYEIKPMKKRIISRFTTTQLIALGFLLIIFMGTALLNLPLASSDGESIGFVDALFTATSATCVTGLVAAPTFSQWSLFGQLVIISLIQIGGLGFMTLIVLVLIIARKKITLKEKILLQESLNQHSLQVMPSGIKRIIMGTLFFEGIIAIILAIRFPFDFGIKKGIYMGIFHSISAFCNAGFDIIGDSSLTPYVFDPVVNLAIMFSIIVGGIGFTVWFDFIEVKNNVRKTGFHLSKAFRNLSLHSKIVFTATLILILGGTLLFFLFEYTNGKTIGNMSLANKIMASFFQSVTTRTAGFNTIDQGNLTYSSKFLSVILMFIGGSPGGTAGGIKTTTLSVLVISLISVIKGRNITYCYKRAIPFYTLQKALAVFLLSTVTLVVFTMALTITEQSLPSGIEFIDILYETASALGTVGLTSGVTSSLSSIGKLLLSLAMFLGRIGPITLAIALGKRQTKYEDALEYPSENVMVG